MQNGAHAYVDAHRQRRRWLAVLGVLAVLVVFVTAYALMMPASTLTADSAEEATETAALPDGAAVPDGYAEQYTVQDEDNGFTVTVYAAEGVVPEGATLSASLLSEDDDAYATAEEALAEDADDDDEYGFAALDIHFEDADGNEVEPGGEVYVVIDAQGLLPEDADTVTVQHHAESDEGVTVETVADAADETDGVVAVTDDTAVQAAFTVESFSTFTITYNKTNGITVHLVDTNGNELDIDTDAFDDLNSTYNPTDFADKYILNQWVDVEELAATWAYVTDGYTYQAAYRVQMTGSGNNLVDNWSSKTQIYWIRYNTTGTNSNSAGWYYSSSTTVPGGTGTAWGNTYHIYLVYEPVTESTQGGNLQIQDNVKSDGTFVASYTGDNVDDSSELYYVWQEWNESESEWEDITQLKVNGNQYLLSGDGNNTFNVVLQVVGDDDDAGGGWYQVKVYESQEAYEDGEEPLATSESYQLSYYDELQNGSFETPDVNDLSTGSKSNYQYPVGTDGLIWKTTGDDQQIEIVNATNDLADGSSDYNNSYGAVDGDQYAELNCEAAGALYQDVLTVPGTTLNWQFSHRGRNGDDTMYLLIAPTAAVENITTQNELKTLVEEIQESGTWGTDGSYTYTAGGYTYYLVSQTTGNTSWSTVTGSYDVPEGQYLTRFFFVAGNTASGNDTVGNLLDNVYFTTGLLPAEEGTANLQVTKVVEGVDDLPNDYTVTVTVTSGGGDDAVNETVTLTNFNQQSATTWTATGSVTNISIPANESVTLTVTETSTSTIDGYTGPTTTVQVDESETTSASTTVILKEQDHGTVTFTNSYIQDITIEPVDPDVSKYVYDNEDGTYDLSLSVTGTTVKEETKTVNILYILDESYSMMWNMDGTFPGSDYEDVEGTINPDGDYKYEYDNENQAEIQYSYERFNAAKAAINALNNVLLNADGLEVNVALVPFAKEVYTNQIVNWTELTAITDLSLPDSEWETFASGTNYYAALTSAQSLVSSAPEGDETIVVFITDGEPNWPREDGVHQDIEYSKQQAAAAVAALTADRFYAVGVGNEVGDTYLSELIASAQSGVTTGSSVSGSTSELIDYFAEIAADITGSVTKDVTITDQLSEYAQLVSESAVPTITITNSEGTAVTVTAPDQLTAVTDEAGNVTGYRGTYTFTENGGTVELTYTYTIATKTFTLEFPEDYELTQNWTYTITVEIEPTETAINYDPTKDDEEERDGYPNIGDEGTDAPGNSTSSSQAGFYSNTDANLTYEDGDGKSHEKEYPRPVIQVTTVDLTFEKVDSTNANTTLSGAKFVLYKIETVSVGDGEEGATQEVKYYYTETTDETTGTKSVSWESDLNGAYHFTSAEETGTFTLENLVIGQTYYLSEVVAPDGYQLPANDIQITWTGNTPYITMGDTMIRDTNNNAYYEIPNTTGQELPATGGSGTTYLTISGLLLVAIAVGGGFATKRLRKSGTTFDR